MRAALRLEFYKNKHRGLLLTVFALVVVEIAWMYIAFRNPTAQQLKIGWMDMLYELPSLNSIIFPLIAAIIASRLADVEHKGDTWKLLGTVQKTKSLFIAKFLCGAWYLFLCIAFLTIAMLTCGLILHYDGQPNLQKYLLFFAFQMLIALEILAFQLSLSLLIRNQMISLCIGCGGSFVGLFLLFVPFKPAQYLLPWGHASLLFLVYMVSWDPENRLLELAYCPINWFGLAVAILELFIFIWAGRVLLSKREV